MEIVTVETSNQGERSNPSISRDTGVIHQKGGEDAERYTSYINVCKKGVSFAYTRHVSTVGTFSRERLK